MPEFEFRSVPEQPIASLRLRSPLDAIGEAMAAAFPKIYAAVAGSGGVPAGPPLARYLSFGGPVIDFECAVPLAKPFVGNGDIKPGTVGGGEAAVAIHMGPYETISQTWEALGAWLEEQGREPAGPSWEYYLTDPDQEPDPSRWVTEVYIPVRPAAVPAVPAR